MQQQTTKPVEKPDLKVVKNLYQKLLEIRKKIPYLQKTGKNPLINSTFVEGDIMLAKLS